MKNRFLSISALLLVSPFLSSARGGGHAFGHSCSHATTNAAIMTAAAHSHSYNSLNGMPSGSFPGTVIYNHDTINGTIQYKAGQFLVSNTNTTLKIKPADTALTSLTLHKSDTTLTLVRLAPKDKQLYRVIHSGKLNVYDTRADFIPDATHVNRLIMVQNGQTLPSAGFKSQRRWLITYVNQAYGAQFANDAEWNELFAYLDKAN